MSVKNDRSDLLIFQYSINQSILQSSLTQKPIIEVAVGAIRKTAFTSIRCPILFESSIMKFVCKILVLTALVGKIFGPLLYVTA